LQRIKRSRENSNREGSDQGSGSNNDESPYKEVRNIYVQDGYSQDRTPNLKTIHKN
jgi:hypothetical protein